MEVIVIRPMVEGGVNYRVGSIFTTADARGEYLMVLGLVERYFPVGKPLPEDLQPKSVDPPINADSAEPHPTGDAGNVTPPQAALSLTGFGGKRKKQPWVTTPSH